MNDRDRNLMRSIANCERLQADLAALREELAEYKKILDSYKNNYVTKLAYNAVQSSLADAERRNAVMAELLIACGIEFSTSEANAWEVAMRDMIDAALKLTESGARG